MTLIKSKSHSYLKPPLSDANISSDNGDSEYTDAVDDTDTFERKEDRDSSNILPGFLRGGIKKSFTQVSRLMFYQVTRLFNLIMLFIF